MRFILTTMLLLIVCQGTAHAGLNWVNFTVTRHVDTTFTATTFDNAMTDVNDRMKFDNHDCADDVPCSARFWRSGAVGTFGTLGDGLNVITTQGELDAVFAVMTHRVKVVDAVDFCAGAFNTSIIGCGRCLNFGYILEDWVGGAVYVHEYGHNVLGCGHRDDCSNNIMHSTSIGTNNSVNSSECSGFGGHAYLTLCGNVYDDESLFDSVPLTASGGPYWVTCDVTVPAGETLTIGAGVEIQFDPGRRITSFGTTTANGNSGTINVYSNNDSKSILPSVTIKDEMVIKNGSGIILH